MNRPIRILAYRIVVSLLICTVVLGGVTRVWAAPKIKSSITPVQISFDQSNVGEESEIELASYHVADGKYLVIEMVTVLAQTPALESLILVIETTVGGTTARHYVSPTKIWDYDQLDYIRLAGTHMMQVVADPGSTVNLLVKRITACSNGDCLGYVECSGSLSGYLVDGWIIE